MSAQTRAELYALHALLYRIVDGGTLYACACGDWEDVADGFEVEESLRLYTAHAAHIEAAAAGGVA